MALRGPDLAALYLPIGLASQAALLIAAARPSGRRCFWVGFVSGGVCALIATAGLELARPGPLLNLWGGYLSLLGTLFGTLPRMGAGHPEHGLLQFAVVASFFLPAQLLLAFAGGVLTTILGQSRIRRSTHGLDGAGREIGARPPGRPTDGNSARFTDADPGPFKTIPTEPRQSE
jgi:hypothetical protein